MWVQERNNSRVCYERTSCTQPGILCYYLYNYCCVYYENGRGKACPSHDCQSDVPTEDVLTRYSTAAHLASPRWTRTYAAPLARRHKTYFRGRPSSSLPVRQGAGAAAYIDENQLSLARRSFRSVAAASIRASIISSNGHQWELGSNLEAKRKCRTEEGEAEGSYIYRR
jgi:hypothetical protein